MPPKPQLWGRIFLILFHWVMLAGVGEESLKVDLESSCIVLGEADGTDKSLIVALTVKISAVDSAKVNEVESTSAHYKKRLKGVALVVGGGGNIVEDSAISRQLELAYTCKSAVIIGRISQKLRLVCNTAFFADIFLFGF